VPIDPKTLPQDADTLRKIVVDLIEQLDHSLGEQNKYQNLLRELLEAQRNRKSEQLTKEQLALFEAAWQAQHPESQSDEDDDDDRREAVTTADQWTEDRGDARDEIDSEHVHHRPYRSDEEGARDQGGEATDHHVRCAAAQADAPLAPGE